MGFVKYLFYTSGTNFPYYPDGSHLIVVDPNPYFVDYYNDNKKNFPNIKSENIIVSTGKYFEGMGVQKKYWLITNNNFYLQSFVRFDAIYYTETKKIRTLGKKMIDY